MTETFVQFEDRPYVVPGGSRCAACGTKGMLGHDHCHEHGWIRGIACMTCNSYLGIVDSLLTPLVGEERLAALLAIRNSCPECEPLTAADLERPGRRARENRLRRMAARQGFGMSKSCTGRGAYGPGIYTLTPVDGDAEEFPSTDAAMGFLYRRLADSFPPR